MHLSSWARWKTSHRLDATLNSSMVSGVTRSRQRPVSLTPPRWVTSRACRQQVRLRLRDLTSQSWRELTSGPLGLCCYNWLTPLSGLSWPHVLPLSYPIPEWNHSVNGLIQPHAKLLIWCVIKARVCVFLIVFVCMYESESTCTCVWLCMCMRVHCWILEWRLKG